MPKATLPNFAQLKKQFSQFTFAPHEVFHWSANTNTVYYNPKKLNSDTGYSQLLHELGHALLSHRYFTSGIELVKMETDAWQKAKEIAQQLEFKISPSHIEKCLDSYRDWLHLRSVCPNCKNVSVETSMNHYQCFNCLQKWQVPKDQRSRRYRLKQTASN